MRGVQLGMQLSDFLLAGLDGRPHIKPNVSPKTHERYGDLLNKNLAPLLGAKILSKL